jgi:hypothetical protein
MHYFIVRTDAAGEAEVRFPVSDEAVRGITRGDRVAFYRLAGEGDGARGAFVAWGEVERLRTEGEEGVAQLKAVTPLRRRVPFAELRSDPRRNREARIQPVSADVFNLILSRSRR